MLLFKYPAHDVDSYIVMSAKAWTLYLEAVRHKQPSQLLAQLVDDALRLSQSLQDSPIPLHFHVFNYLDLPAGIELGTHELDDDEISDITDVLKNRGHTVIKARYGSHMHHAWNPNIGD